MVQQNRFRKLQRKKRSSAQVSSKSLRLFQTSWPNSAILCRREKTAEEKDDELLNRFDKLTPAGRQSVWTRRFECSTFGFVVQHVMSASARHLSVNATVAARFEGNLWSQGHFQDQIQHLKIRGDEQQLHQVFQNNIQIKQFEKMTESKRQI